MEHEMNTPIPEPEIPAPEQEPIPQAEQAIPEDAPMVEEMPVPEEVPAPEPETQPEQEDLSENMEPLIPGGENTQQLAEVTTEMAALIEDAENAPPAKPEASAPAEPAVPELTPEEEKAQRLNRRKRRRRGALRFYISIFALVLATLILVCCAMSPLKSWLGQFQLSQSVHTSDEIFNLLFAQPDWGLLYDMAGIQPTQFEGKSHYIAYMQAKVGDTPLEYVEIAAGLGGQRRFSVRAQGEQIGTFTMLPVDDGVSSFTRWTFGALTLDFTCTESVTVNIMPGQTVYINNVPLDDSYTTMQVCTEVEAMLPAGVHGYRYEQVQIHGLLVQPEVVVLDRANIPVTLTQDPETLVYTTPIANTTPITQSEYDLVLAAVQSDLLFCVQAAPLTTLRQYFDPNSQAYSDICNAAPMGKATEVWAFDESATVIDSYYRYNNKLFSVRAHVKLDVTGEDGGITSYELTISYFVSPNSSGRLMVQQRTTADLQALVITQLPGHEDAAQ